jgi:hypothetical protein
MRVKNDATGYAGLTAANDATENHPKNRVVFFVYFFANPRVRV